jgi:hypothetical protein
MYEDNSIEEPNFPLYLPGVYTGYRHGKKIEKIDPDGSCPTLTMPGAFQD